jgi:hypothetical protein
MAAAVLVRQTDHKLDPACIQRMSLEQAGMKPGFCQLKLTGGIGSIRIGSHGMFGKFDYPAQCVHSCCVNFPYQLGDRNLKGRLVQCSKLFMCIL